MPHSRTGMRLTRRQFGGIVSAAATMPMLRASPSLQQPRPQQPDYVVPPRPVLTDAPQFAGKLEFTRKQITRLWKRGDRVEVALPMHLHVEAMPDAPQMQAFLYGPLVLAGDLGNEGLTEAHLVGPNFRVGAANHEQHGSPLAPTNRTPPIADIEIPTFRAAGSDPSSWIKPADRPQVFRTTGQKQNVTLMPLNRLFDRRYSVYWHLT